MGEKAGIERVTKNEEDNKIRKQVKDHAHAHGNVFKSYAMSLRREIESCSYVTTRTVKTSIS